MRTSGQRMSGCNVPGAKVDSNDPSVPCVTLPNGTVKPLFGKGSGRGRKKCVCVCLGKFSSAVSLLLCRTV